MGARELLREMVGAGFSVEADGDKLVIRPASNLTDDLRMALRQAKPELLELLGTPGGPYRLTHAEADEAHAVPWTEEDITRFSTRVLLFLRRAAPAADADDLAERLHLRDLRCDDRRLCLECRHLSRGRCGNHVVAGVGRDLPAELMSTLQRCSGFDDGVQ